MNLAFFIAKRISAKLENKQNISNGIVRISIVAITLSVAVMVLAVAIVTGFKSEIRAKVMGFGSHVTLTKYDANESYQTSPISAQQSWLPALKELQNVEYFEDSWLGEQTRTTRGGVRHIQRYAIKPGIIKTADNMQGVVLKGVGSDFDWQYFSTNIVEGTVLQIDDTQKTDAVVVSRYLCNQLRLKLGDDIVMYFIQDPPRFRKFNIVGIYNTGLEDFDKVFVFCDIGHVQKLNDWNDTQITGFEVLLDYYEDIDPMGVIISDAVGFNYTSNDENVKVETIKEHQRAIFDWIELSDTNVWVILGVTLFVAVINMISGLLVIILERVNMIGIFKALGANNRQVQSIFLYKAFLIVGKGMLWGNIVGIALCLLQKYFKLIPLDATSYYIDAVPINLNWSFLLALNIGTLIITMLSLLLPAMIISQVSPAKTIKFN